MGAGASKYVCGKQPEAFIHSTEFFLSILLNLLTSAKNCLSTCSLQYTCCDILVMQCELQLFHTCLFNGIYLNTLTNGSKSSGSS